MASPPTLRQKLCLLKLAEELGNVYVIRRAFQMGGASAHMVEEKRDPERRGVLRRFARGPMAKEQFKQEVEKDLTGP